MNEFDLLLSFLLGCAGAVVAWLVLRLTDGRRAWSRFRDRSDRVVELVHHLVSLRYEQAMVEAEIAKELEEHPPDRSVWVAKMTELAGTLPPVVLEQLKRFGLAEPPPEAPPQVSALAQSVPPPALPQRLGDNVVAIDEWTGRVIEK